MNRAALRLAALVLPLTGLGALWLIAGWQARSSSEWDVPIQGYDPRDLLQGHYVQFQYEWPGLLRGSDRPANPSVRGLCLIGAAPRIDRVEPADEAPGCPGRFVAPGQDKQGRLYTSQAEAQRLQQQLSQSGKAAMVHFRLRSDGRITPLNLWFDSPRAAVAPEERTP